MTSMPPVYLLNLDRSSDRLAFLTEQARAIGFEFTRIAGIDGKTLSPLAGLKPAELGCFLSHRLAWQAIVAQNSRWGVVLEDDVRISRDFARLLADMSWAPHDADLVRLEACIRWVKLYRKQAGEALGRHLYRLKGSMFGAAGYAISRTACKMLLSETAAGVGFAADNFLFSPASPVFGRLTTYVLIPAPVIQQSFLPPAMIGGQPFESMIRPTRIASRQANRRPLHSIRLRVRKSLKAMIQPHLFYRQIDWA